MHRFQDVAVEQGVQGTQGTAPWTMEPGELMKGAPWIKGILRWGKQVKHAQTEQPD